MNNRFHTDTVGEEYNLRQEQILKQKRAQEFRRKNAIERDEKNWSRLDQKAKEEEDYFQRLRDDGSKAKKNASSVAYDLQTLQYSQDQEV